MRAMFRKSLIQRTLILAAVGGASVAAAQVVGCSSPGAAATGGSTPAQAAGDPGAGGDNAGSVGMALTLPGGEVINTVNWTVTGPNGGSTVVQTGTVAVGNSQTLTFLIGGIPAGAGYTVALSGQSTDGSVTCTGSATFSTSARTTTNVSVALQCSSPASEAGSALVNGTTFNCAAWNSAAASPAEAIVGNSVNLSATATGPNPAGLTYAWTASSGTLSTPTSSTSQFTCTTPGTATITLTVGDGVVPDGGTCSASAATTTVQVTCDGHLDQAATLATATKIKHVIIVFGENISYDHYFGTYPVAQNNPGDTPFTAAPGTPVGNGLTTPLDPTHSFAPLTGLNLLTNNPNLNAANGAGASNPFRLNKSQAATSDQGHNYNPEQKASDDGGMDLFPLNTGSAGPPPVADSGAPAAALTKGLVMAYYDGNTVNAFWNFAQNYSLNDNSWTTTFGPSTPGAVNLISGQTNGIVASNKVDGGTFSSSHVIADGNGNYTMIGDIDPLNDVCSSAADQGQLAGKTIGDALNAAGITWGFFEGGFNLSLVNANGTTGCARSTAQTVANSATPVPADYVPHHQPFQYFASTANPTHARPGSVAAIGTTDAANHQYDTADFFAALAAGNLPAVVYLKAPAYQDGHPGNSNPVDEQNFVLSVVNAVQAAQEWSSTAIIFNYDDSDGWYDHQAPPIVNPSFSTVGDALNGTGVCNSGAQQTGPAPATPLLGAPLPDGGAPAPVQGRCGYGTRVPLLVVSPFAKRNFIDHTLTDQTSSFRFIEDNWLSSQRLQPGGSFDTIANSITNMLQGD